MARARNELLVLPLREELEALARYSHRLESQRSRLGLGSARRHLDDHLADVRERFELTPRARRALAAGGS